MVTMLRAFGRWAREVLAKAPRKQSRDGAYPRLPTCCQLDRMKNGWPASL